MLFIQIYFDLDNNWQCIYRPFDGYGDFDGFDAFGHFNYFGGFDDLWDVDDEEDACNVPLLCFWWFLFRFWWFDDLTSRVPPWNCEHAVPLVRLHKTAQHGSTWGRCQSVSFSFWSNSIFSSNLFATRVAKCHRYDRLICVNFLEVWGKISECNIRASCVG